MSNSVQPFHLAIPVNDLNKMRLFYRENLGCEEGRSSEQWVDFNFFGHQLVIHETGEMPSKPAHNGVDGHDVPVPHFGVVLTETDWHALANRLKDQGQEFVIEPYIRFEGLPGEQGTFFFYDPEGNALEFKTFKHLNQLFEK